MTLRPVARLPQLLAELHGSAPMRDTSRAVRGWPVSG
jgi:hypothetical protein